MRVRLVLVSMMIALPMLCLACGGSSDDSLSDAEFDALFEEGVKQFFSDVDANGDGVISRAEYVDALDDAMQVLSTDGDADIDAEDYEPIDSDDVFPELDGDSDGDGRLTQEEYVSVLNRDFTTLDQDADDALTLEEMLRE